MSWFIFWNIVTDESLGLAEVGAHGVKDDGEPVLPNAVGPLNRPTTALVRAIELLLLLALHAVVADRRHADVREREPQVS